MTGAENPTSNGHPRAGPDAGNVAAARAALDVMLTDAAGSQGRASRFLDPGAAVKLTDLVSHAISLGADLQGMFGCSTPTLQAVSGVRVVLRHTGRARSPACLSVACPCPFVADFRAPFPLERVHLTSIYSKGDGGVQWQTQLVPHANCVDVSGSHVGLIFNRKSYRAIAAALAASELRPESQVATDQPRRAA